MSRTRRRDWLGRIIRDGQHGHHCPEPNCECCAAAKTRRQDPLQEDVADAEAAKRERSWLKRQLKKEANG